MTKDEELKSGNWFADLIMNFAPNPEEIKVTGTAKEMTKTASWEAFSISLVAGLPPGPIGMITIIPELIALTKIQINLVYKIAKYYEKEQKVTPTIILHILATAMGIVLGRNLLRKMGTRIIVKALSSRAIQKVAQKLGMTIATRVIARIGGRWIPIVTAPIFAYFSKSQTRRIGEAAIAVFSDDIEFEKMTTCSQGHEVPEGSKFCPECGEKIEE